MVFTDFAFSSVKNWLLGDTVVAPSGMLVGTGSGTAAYTNTLLGSPLDPTRRGIQSRSGIGFTVEFEGLVDSGDIITGSLVHEIGMLSQSGGNVWFRSLTSEIELNGSVLITPIVSVWIR